MPDRAALLERVALALSRLGLVPPPFPAPFFDAYVGSMTARAVMAGASLGVFAALADEPDDAAGLARRLGLVEHRLELLLAVLVSLGYLRRRRGRYRLSRSARRWLSPGGRVPLDSVVGGLAYWNWRGMDALESVLRGGEPIGLHDRPADDPLWPDYQAAMAQLSRLTADVVARLVPAHDPRRLLDLAGGPGMHSAAMCRRHPRLEATVVELEAPASLARERLEAEGLADRVRYLTGDLFEVDLGEGYDVVTAHSILHNLGADRCVELLRRARAAARPGGCVAVLEVEQPEPGRPGSLIATAGSLAFLTYSDTRCWTRDELEGSSSRRG
ncbi:MAG TPA: methyltransferase [Solirubrobacterales bacterium]|nr:methyltransferase [Solirubrobacterales bacterium]